MKFLPLLVLNACLTGTLPLAAAAQPAAAGGGPNAPYVPKQTDRAVPVTGDEPGFVSIFDGKTLDCLHGKGDGGWRVDNGVLVKVPESRWAAQTVEVFGDGETRIRFEISEGDYFSFTARQTGDSGFVAEFSGTDRVKSLVGKAHELIFTSWGDTTTATLDGQPLDLKKRPGPPRTGPLQFNSHGTLRVLSIDFRELAGPNP